MVKSPFSPATGPLSLFSDLGRHQTRLGVRGKNEGDGRERGKVVQGTACCDSFLATDGLQGSAENVLFAHLDVETEFNAWWWMSFDP